MCKHAKLELSGRIENFKGHKHINIFMCKICGKSVIYNENVGVENIDYRYFI